MFKELRTVWDPRRQPATPIVVHLSEAVDLGQVHSSAVGAHTSGGVTRHSSRHPRTTA